MGAKHFRKMGYVELRRLVAIPRGYEHVCYYGVA